jgi:hypothetical protein
MTTNDWFAASLTEIHAFLDRFEDEEVISLSREDDVTAALVAMLTAGVLIAQASGALAHSYNTLQFLEG